MKAENMRLLEQADGEKLQIDGIKRDLTSTREQNLSLSEHLENLQKVNKSQANLITHLQQMLRSTLYIYIYSV